MVKIRQTFNRHNFISVDIDTNIACIVGFWGRRIQICYLNFQGAKGVAMATKFIQK